MKLKSKPVKIEQQQPSHQQQEERQQPKDEESIKSPPTQTTGKKATGVNLVSNYMMDDERRLNLILE